MLHSKCAAERCQDGENGLLGPGGPPIIGGLLGSYFAAKEVSIDLSYRGDLLNASEVLSLSAVSFRGLDFVFFCSAITGLYA